MHVTASQPAAHPPADSAADADANAAPTGLSVRDDSLIDDHVIGRADMKRSFAELRAGVKNPAFGLFGPGSVMWQVVEPLPALPFMLMNAGLMEGLHPKIIFGTTGSAAQSDFAPRFYRSYDAFADWFCGDVDAAIKTARRIHGYHSRIGGPAPQTAGNVQEGQEYAASEEDLMLWTMATQVIPLKLVYEKLVRRLTPAENDRYWDECRVFAKFFGISDAVLPDSWQAFMEYFDRYNESGELEATTAEANGGYMYDQSELRLRTRLPVRLFYTMHFNLMPDSLRKLHEPYSDCAKPHPWRCGAAWFAAKLLLKVLPNAISTTPRLTMARRRAGAGPNAGRFEAWLHAKLPHPFGTAQPSLGIPSTPEADPAKSATFTRVPAP